MFSKLLLVSLLLSSVSAFAESYRVRLETKRAHRVERWFEEHGYDVAGANERKGVVDVITSKPNEISRLQDTLKRKGLIFTIAKIEKSRPLRSGEDGLEGYYDVEDVTRELRKLESRYSKFAKVHALNTWFRMPKTAQGNEIYALQVGENPGELEDKPVILIIGMHHAREVMTPHAVLDSAADLLEKASSRRGESFLRKASVWFVPVVNPDGLHYVHTTDNMWRKNLSKNSNGTFGVDLNRNYGFKWGACGSTSNDPSSETFMGRRAFSEVETQVMDRLNDVLRARYLVSYHSYGDEVIYPYVCADMVEKETVFAVRDKLTRDLGFGARLASASGEDFEYHYNRYGTIGFVVELGDDFQPPFAQYTKNVRPKVLRVVPSLLEQFAGSFLETEVRDGQGRPIHNASIKLEEVRFREGELRTTNSFGKYLWRLTPGEYNVTVSLPNGAEQTQTITVSPNSMTQLSVSFQ